MPNKDELEEQVNDRLDTDIEWSRLKKDDLVEFREGLQQDKFVKKVVAQYANDKTGDAVEGQIEDWEPGALLGLLAQASSGEASIGDILYRM